MFKPLNESRANALVILLNASLADNPHVVLKAVAFESGGYYVTTEEGKIRIFGGDGSDLYKLHFGGTLLSPGVIVKGHTYDGIAKLFNSIELIR